MAKKSIVKTKSIEETLWDSANKLSEDAEPVVELRTLVRIPGVVAVEVDRQ